MILDLFHSIIDLAFRIYSISIPVGYGFSISFIGVFAFLFALFLLSKIIRGLTDNE